MYVLLIRKQLFIKYIEKNNNTTMVFLSFSQKYKKNSMNRSNPVKPALGCASANVCYTLLLIKEFENTDENIQTPTIQTRHKTPVTSRELQRALPIPIPTSLIRHQWLHTRQQLLQISIPVTPLQSYVLHNGACFHIPQLAIRNLPITISSVITNFDNYT